MKKGALEMSIGTIIIIVLAVVMLILGIVFVRNIMCVGIGLTGDINGKVRGEINKLFEYSEGEIVCIGEGTDAVKIIPGEVNFVYCSADVTQSNAEYEFKIVDYSGESYESSDIKSWVVGDDELTAAISPGDESPQKIVKLRVPKDAAEEIITLKLEWRKKIGSNSYGSASSKVLDFQISRKGFVRATVC